MTEGLKAGDKAPSFEGIAHTGEKVRLEDFKGRPVVLYFYPRAMTPGCTREAQRFEELYEKFKEYNAVVIGVSTDTPERNKRFAEKLGIKNVVLVGDPEARIVDLYGVRKKGVKRPSAERVTFIIDGDQVIREVLRNVKPAEKHVDLALETLKRISTG